MIRHGFNDSFAHEIKMMKKLQHPKVANLVDSYQGGHFSSTVMVMDLISGENLGKNYRKLKNNPDKTVVRETMLSWFKQCTEALAYLHSKKIIHRDAHLGNWMLNSVTNEVFLIDFGTAQYLPDGLMKPGHPDYHAHNPFEFAPEAYLEKEYTFNADVFSIAVQFSIFHHENHKNVFYRA